MNLLTDLPEMTIANDSVDDELVTQPQHWDIGFIRRFMLVFGTISSVFDFVTFGVLLWWLRASEIQFRTGWFLESVVSATLVVLVVRTRRPLTKSWPSRGLMVATGVVIVVTLVLPWTPSAGILGFAPLTARYLLAIGMIVVAYVATAEFAKAWFFGSLNRKR
jgi:Mg2+-importing ATPase